MTNYKPTIDAQLERLGLSTNFNPYSGILSEAVPSLGVVKLYDDYVSGVYSAESVANLLKAQETLDLEGFWQLIAECEISPD